MWTQATSPPLLLLLLLLACCLWSSDAQRQSPWGDPIKFNTKMRDQCAMTVTGQRDQTRLRISCQSRVRSYWCEYTGKPQSCQTYNKNPRHYFLQMSWILRKLQNACEGPRQIKPQMCKKVTAEAQMVLSAASSSQTLQEVSARARTAAQAARPESQPAPTRRQTSKSVVRIPIGGRTVPQRTPPPTLTPPMESHARRTARLYCWRSLHGVCSYVIGLFRN